MTVLKSSLFCILIFFLRLVASVEDLPTVEMTKTYAPNVSPWSGRSTPVRLKLDLNVTVRRGKLDDTNDYDFWNYDDHVPGPFIRARVGDWLDVNFHNFGYNVHGVDFHAVFGPGGGEKLIETAPNTVRRAGFQMLIPGLYVYHCGTSPVPNHLSQGLYGLFMVEPSTPLRAVDREFYVVKSEFYTEPSYIENLLKYSYSDGLNETPQYVVFNGHRSALTSAPLKANVNDRVRIYFGNAGPNQAISFHVIGVIFERVYREGDLTSTPALNLQTTLVPAGGSVVVEFQVLVPGNYNIVDHSIYRIQRGALGVLTVDGPPRPDVYCTYETVFDPTYFPTCTQSWTTTRPGGEKDGGFNTEAEETTVAPPVDRRETTSSFSKNDAVNKFGFFVIFLALCVAYIYRTYEPGVSL